MKKYVFITGASSGFGEACAHIFAKNGFSLVLVARRSDKLEQLKVSLQNDTVNIHCLELDIRNEKEVIQSINSLNENNYFYFEYSNIYSRITVITIWNNSKHFYKE